MDVSNIMHAKDLPFEVSDATAKAIETFIEAAAKDDPMLDGWGMELWCTAKAYGPNLEFFVEEYYSNFGWLRDPKWERNGRSVDEPAPERRIMPEWYDGD